MAVAVRTAGYLSALSLLFLLPPRPGPELIALNDNRNPAGSLRNGVLSVRLEARNGIWQPDGASGAKITVAAFGEPGRPLRNPGPVLRVPAGTEIRASVTNRLAAPLWIYGMGTARGFRSDSFDIAPGATREIRFRVADAGLFYYAGRTTKNPVFARTGDDSQLHGVIAVDPAGARTRPADRIFVVSTWFTIDSTSRSGLGPHPNLSFNGRSWPHTESLTATQGDSLHWRFVNLTPFEHPLHLHGFYFTVDAKGDGVRDTAYGPGARRLGVTEVVLPGQTMGISWLADRSGNWIFHCHLASHIASEAALEADRRMPPAGTMSPMLHAAAYPLPRRGNPMQDHMSGLVLGIRVAPKGRAPVSTRLERPIRLIIRSRASVYGDYAGYSYVLGGSAAEADPAAMPVPGPTLVLEKNQPVAITIVNRSHEEAAVHWHGIELASLPDGVGGWSGNGITTLPMIAPGDSFTVHFTPPRAGTFMYHSHSNEFQQIGSGLYGAIVVTDSPATRDSSTDRVLLFSDDGPTVNFFRPPPAALLNGRPLSDTLALRAGVPERLRFINIRTDFMMTLRLLDGGTPVRWRTVAKDGADLPASAAETAPHPAVITLSPGETADVELTPAAGPLGLEVTLPMLKEVPAVVVPVAAR